MNPAVTSSMSSFCHIPSPSLRGKGRKESCYLLNPWPQNESSTRWCNKVSLFEASQSCSCVGSMVVFEVAITAENWASQWNINTNTIQTNKIILLIRLPEAKFFILRQGHYFDIILMYFVIIDTLSWCLPRWKIDCRVTTMDADRYDGILSLMPNDRTLVQGIYSEGEILLMINTGHQGH